MGSHAISFHASPRMEMIRDAFAIFKDSRTHRRVRRATLLISAQQFPGYAGCWLCVTAQQNGQLSGGIYKPLGAHSTRI